MKVCLTTVRWRLYFRQSVKAVTCPLRAACHDWWRHRVCSTSITTATSCSRTTEICQWRHAGVSELVAETSVTLCGWRCDVLQACGVIDVMYVSGTSCTCHSRHVCTRDGIRVCQERHARVTDVKQVSMTSCKYQRRHTCVRNVIQEVTFASTSFVYTL